MACRDLTRLSPTTLLSLIVVSSTLLGGCKPQEVPSHWIGQPVKVDGEMTDWQGIPTTYFKENDAQLGLCNDSENLYILFRFSNQLWARAIRLRGLTIWLDSSGKKRGDFGLRYLGGSSPSEMQEAGTGGQGGFWESLTSEQKKHFLQRQAVMANRITVINKEGNVETTIPANGSRGPAADFGVLQGVYTYEFRIPLQKGDISNYGIGTQPGQAISLGLEWGGTSRDDRQHVRKKMGGRPPGGGKGVMGGWGEHGGRPGSQPPGKQEFWVKTNLATSPTGR